MNCQNSKVMGSEIEKDKAKFYYLDSYGFVQVIYASSLEEAMKIWRERHNRF